MLDDAVEFVGEENIVRIVTDNAVNFNAVGGLLMQKGEHLYWIPCVSHCIHLIIEDFEKQLKVHETTIKKERRITTYIYGRTMLISILKKFTKRKDLIRPVMTRFTATYWTLPCLYEMKTSLMTMFNSKEWKQASLELHKKGEKFKMWY